MVLIKKQDIKYLIIGILSAIALFLLFGIPTALIPNPWSVRMIEGTAYDYLFLTINSILMGAYIGVHYYKKNTNLRCNIASSSGGLGSFLAISCPICNKILVLLFGTTVLLTYFEPYRPLLGFASISLLVGAIYWRIKK